MLAYLRHRSSDRKFRLFALACCLHAGRFAEDRAVLEMLGHFADVPTEPEKLWTAYVLLPDTTGRKLAVPRLFGEDEALSVAEWAQGGRGPGEKEAQCRILRDVFHHQPRRPTFRQWRVPEVLTLAQAIYSRQGPTGALEGDALLVLSDAVEEAGCTDADLLAHLRSLGQHVRGCWALDLVLGKQ
jgi:hypothetical protein